jgi:hypothetical protein
MQAGVQARGSAKDELKEQRNGTWGKIRMQG